MSIKKTKIFSIYTDELKEVKDVFWESIKDDWDVNIEYWGKAGSGDGDFASEGFYNVQRRKINFLIEKIKENWGDVIIYADIDIQFFGKCSDIIDHAIKEKDFVFQAEHSIGKEVNVGFSVIRCNDKTLSTYQSILDFDFKNLPIADQSAMNLILEKSEDLIWDVLPRQFWAMSHYVFDLSVPPNDVLLHHANCTRPKIVNNEKIGSVQLKMEQFMAIRNYVLLQRQSAQFYSFTTVNNFLPEFKQLIKKIKTGAVLEEPNDEDSIIVVAFYLVIALVKLIKTLYINIDSNIEELFQPFLENNLFVSIEPEEAQMLYIENKEILKEIILDINGSSLNHSCDIPNWLGDWMVFWLEKFAEFENDGINNLKAYKLILKQVSYMITNELSMNENTKRLLFLFINQAMAERKSGL